SCRSTTIRRRRRRMRRTSRTAAAQSFRDGRAPPGKLVPPAASSAAFALAFFVVRVVGKRYLLDVDALVPACPLGDEPDLLDLRLGHRHERPEPAREAGPEARELDHRDRRVVAELRRTALIREALLA